MGAITGLLGGAPQANIVNPTNQAQLQTAYNGTQSAMGDQGALLTALQGQNGLGNQSQVYGQLQGVVNGTGPNPATALLNQQTGANVANQAALMAGQRGAGANVGLMARQAAQQGANTQQQAVGQAATTQANQSLNALSAAGSLANTQAANQISQTNANTSAQQAEQANLMGAQAAANNANVQSQANANATNAGTLGMIGSGVGGLLNSAGGLSGMLGGGAAAAGGSTAAAGGLSAGGGLGLAAMAATGGDISQVAAKQGVPTGPRSHVTKAMLMRTGGPVQAAPGQQAQVPGNSLKNDKIPALLSEHEIVIPRSITMSKNAPEQAAKFVAAAIAKRGRK